MKITIITSAYNSVATLRETMESVLRQGYTDYEYIVVDGSSKDGTVDLIREYEPRFEGRMRWISEPDRGIYDAMNKGVAMATGDVVGLLNSDDFYASDDVLETIAPVSSLLLTRPMPSMAMCIMSMLSTPPRSCATTHRASSLVSACAWAICPPIPRSMYVASATSVMAPLIPPTV